MPKAAASLGLPKVLFSILLIAAYSVSDSYYQLEKTFPQNYVDYSVA
jgi:hypothetical protein